MFSCSTTSREFSNDTATKVRREREGEGKEGERERVIKVVSIKTGF